MKINQVLVNFNDCDSRSLCLSVSLSLLHIYSRDCFPINLRLPLILVYSTKQNNKHAKDKTATDTQEWGNRQGELFKRWHLEQQKQQQQRVRYPCVPRITAIPDHDDSIRIQSQRLGINQVNHVSTTITTISSSSCSLNRHSVGHWIYCTSNELETYSWNI